MKLELARVLLVVTCLRTPGPGVMNTRCDDSGRSHHLTTNLCTIPRLYSVKTDIFQNAVFWFFFIRNDISRVDLIIKVVFEFLSDL